MEDIGMPGFNLHITKFPPRKNGDFAVYIRQSYSIKGKKLKRTIEKYPSWKELAERHGDPDAFLKGRVEALKEKHESEAGKATAKTKTIVFNAPDMKPERRKFNLSSLVLNRAWADLRLEPLLNKTKFDRKWRFGYSINDAARLMSYLRVVSPGSKLGDSRNSGFFVERMDAKPDDLYDALDRISEAKERIVRRISKSCAEAFGSGEAVYYDCTNFYFEIQGEDDDGFRSYGVEKNHRPDTIVEYGLLLDEKGYPVSCGTFKGSQSEKTTIKPLLELGGEATAVKIVVADAGLNTLGNKEGIHDSGRNYIYVQSIKSLCRKESALFDYCTSKDGMSPYGGKGAMYKSCWIKDGKGHEEKLIVKFDPDSERFAKETIAKRLEHIRKFFERPSRLNYDNCQDGKQYIKKVQVDRKTGEVVEADSVLQLNDAYERDLRLAGFYAYVTDIPDATSENDREYIAELRRSKLRCEPKTIPEILDIAGKRVVIEDCFRVMKTDMSARPMFVRKREHIKGHLLIVYIALALISYIKLKYRLSFTHQKLLDVLRGFETCVGETDDGTVYYEKLFCMEETNELIEKAGLARLYDTYVERLEMKRLISLSKSMPTK